MPAASQRPIGQLSHGGLPEHPVGTVEFGPGHDARTDGATRPSPPGPVRPQRPQRPRVHSVHTVGQPPVGLVGQVDERPVPAPGRLADRHIGAPGDATGLGHPGAGVVIQPPTHPQLTAVPGHLWVVPGQPGQVGAVGGRPGSGIEIPPGEHGDGDQRALGIHGHDPVGDAIGAVALLDADEPSAVGRQPSIGVAHGSGAGGDGRQEGRCGGRQNGRGCGRQDGRGDGRGDVAIYLPAVDRLVCLVDVEQRPVLDRGRPAPVLVHSRADAATGRGDVGRTLGRTGPDHDLAPSLVGTALEPIGPPAVDLEAAARHLARRHRGGGKGGRPRSGRGVSPGRTGLGHRLTCHGAGTPPSAAPAGPRPPVELDRATGRSPRVGWCRGNSGTRLPPLRGSPARRRRRRLRRSSLRPHLPRLRPAA